MRAAVLTDFGSALHITDMPDPRLVVTIG